MEKEKKSAKNQKKKTDKKKKQEMNRTPLLACEGLCNARTIHSYKGLKTITRIIKREDWPRDWNIPEDRVAKQVRGYTFACQKCGFERIFGIPADYRPRIGAGR